MKHASTVKENACMRDYYKNVEHGPVYIEIRELIALLLLNICD